MISAKINPPNADANPVSIERPSLQWLGLEPWRAALEFGSHSLSRSPRGFKSDGHPVIIFPGMATGATAVSPLRRYCEDLGYAAADWGWGLNAGPQGDMERWLAELTRHIADMLEPFEQTATLIGWSLGGIYAREVGKKLAPKVRQIVTLGTPFNAADDHTRVGWIYQLLNGNAPALTTQLSTQLRSAPPIPTTSIYSRSDGVVAWQTCLHDELAKQQGQVEDIEVNGSHLGLGWNNKALRVIADRLAQPPGNWRRYEDSSDQSR